MYKELFNGVSIILIICFKSLFALRVLILIRNSKDETFTEKMK